MKKNLLLLFLLLFSFSCTDDINLSDDINPLETRSISRSSIYRDYSGEVETIIVEQSISGYHNELTVSVPSGYVVIGGGASISDKGKWGALLTKTHPNNSLTAWTGASKDHLKKQYHTLTVYAIGLKLKNVSRSTLKDHMILSSTTGPKFYILEQWLPTEYHCIGGGGEVTLTSGPGVLLTLSYPSYKAASSYTPSRTGWHVAAKDHLEKSNANVICYAIGIKPYIEGFGELEFGNSNSLDPSQDYKIAQAKESGILTMTKYVEPGWVPACPFGFVLATGGYGRFIYSLIPGMTTSISSTDHIKFDENRLMAGGQITVRKKQK